LSDAGPSKSAWSELHNLVEDPGWLTINHDFVFPKPVTLHW
jgi:hypothetical protein